MCLTQARSVSVVVVTDWGARVGSVVQAAAEQLVLHIGPLWLLAGGPRNRGFVWHLKPCCKVGLLSVDKPLGALQGRCGARWAWSQQRKEMRAEGPAVRG